MAGQSDYRERRARGLCGRSGCDTHTGGAAYCENHRVGGNQEGRWRREQGLSVNLSLRPEYAATLNGIAEALGGVTRQDALRFCVSRVGKELRDGRLDIADCR